MISDNSRRLGLRRSSYTQYLIALAVADTGAIFCEGKFWLDRCSIELNNFSFQPSLHLSKYDNIKAVNEQISFNIRFSLVNFIITFVTFSIR